MLLRHNRTHGDDQTVWLPQREETVLDAVQTIVGVLVRRWRWIAASVAAALTAALLFLILTKPLYSSNVQVLIDPRGKQILQTEVVPGGLGSSSVGPDTLQVDSQVEIILSDAVLKAAIARKGLEQDREFARVRGLGLGARLVGIGLSPVESISQRRAQTPEAAALETLRRRLNVRRIGNTYVIDVAVRSEVPEKAARLANAIAESYLEDDRQATRASTRQTTTMLMARLDELRQHVNQAESRVEDYREEHGLIGAENMLINEQQLRDLNDRLTNARTRTSETKAKHDALLKVAEGGVSPAESTSEALASTTIAGLRVAYSEAVRALSNASASLGPGHPDFQMLEAERRAIARTIDEELARLVRNAQQEYEVALSHEQSLTAQVDRLQARAGQANKALVTLRELQREASAARAVYEAFLTRARQTTEQEDLSANNSRILAAAPVPTRHVFPPVRIVLIAALVLGAILGCLMAWLSHVWLRRGSPPSLYERGRAGY